jgi:hypothetical protein
MTCAVTIDDITIHLINRHKWLTAPHTIASPVTFVTVMQRSRNQSIATTKLKPSGIPVVPNRVVRGDNQDQSEEGTGGGTSTTDGGNDHQQEVMRNIGLDSVQDGQPDTGGK